MTNKEMAASKIAEDLKERMLRAELNKEKILAEKVAKSAVKKVSPPSSPENISISSINAKLSEASARREAVLAEKISKSTKKKLSPPTSPCSPKSTLSSITARLDDASARARQEHDKVSNGFINLHYFLLSYSVTL